MPPNKKGKRTKQKQKQSQSVVVNVNTRGPARRRKAPTKRGGGGGGGNPYPVYMNSPSDYAPIIHNLPAQYQNQPAITMPVQALANIPTGQTQPTVLPTTLQTNNADERPLGKVVKQNLSGIKQSKMYIDFAELAQAQAKRALKAPIGEIGSNIPRSKAPTQFQEELTKRVETPMKKPMEIPTPRVQKPQGKPLGRPRQFTDEEIIARQQYANTQEGKREMAERQLFAREDPKSAKFGRK